MENMQGSVREEDYFQIEVRPHSEFSELSLQDMADSRSHRVAGKAVDGKWETHKWLIHKSEAYICECGELHSENPEIVQILESIQGDVEHSAGDCFEVRSHRSLKKTPHKEDEMYFNSYAEYEKYFEQSH